MRYFTSDWHFGDCRIVAGQNLLMRPFKDQTSHDWHIYHSFIDSDFKDGDTLYHLGDVIFEDTQFNRKLYLQLRERYPNSKFKLAVGNYDEGKGELLKDIFDEILLDYMVDFGDGQIAYLNHYPEKCREKMNLAKFGITGHIHSLWKVKEDMINVSVDVWNFKPVSEEQILFTWNAIQNHYDQNVFL